MTAPQLGSHAVKGMRDIEKSIYVKTDHASSCLRPGPTDQALGGRRGLLR